MLLAFIPSGFSHLKNGKKRSVFYKCNCFLHIGISFVYNLKGGINIQNSSYNIYYFGYNYRLNISCCIKINYWWNLFVFFCLRLYAISSIRILIKIIYLCKQCICRKIGIRKSYNWENQIDLKAFLVLYFVLWKKKNIYIFFLSFFFSKYPLLINKIEK